MKLAREQCACVLKDAELCDGFKHRPMEELPGADEDDDELFNAADDYFFKCVAEIRRGLRK
jgi:hypothetical protein